MSEEKYIPEIRGNLKRLVIKVPEVLSEASGININGRILKSFMFTTDVAVINNMNADAIISLYPFYPQPSITQSILQSSRVPVFCGIGDHILSSLERIVSMAKQAEYQGACGVVVNSTISNEVIKQINKVIDIPIILTVVSEFTDIKACLESGAAILNVSGAHKTPKIIENIRKEYPYVPIIANGGPTKESIEGTINAGANAITYTPPPLTAIFSDIVSEYRRREKNQ